MATPPDAALCALDATERGFVLGALLLASADEDDALTRPLPSRSRARCGSALAALRALPRTERLRLTTELGRETVTPFPAGIEAVHVDHLRATLEGESPPTLALLLRDAPACVAVAARAELIATGIAEADLGDLAVDAGVLAEVQRAALATIVAAPPASAGADRDRWALALAQGPSAALLAQATAVGARALGARLAAEEAGALGAADLALALAQRLPPALGDELLDGAATLAVAACW